MGSSMTNNIVSGHGTSSGSTLLLPTQASTPSEPLDPVQHPWVQWWIKQSWMNWSDHGNEITILDGSDSEISGKIESTDYLENASGRPLDKTKHQQLYAHAQLIWGTFARNSSTGPPPTYKMAPLDYLKQYHAEMEREIAILQLCECHLKADQVWILNYPSWL